MKHSKDWKAFIKYSSDIKDKDIHPNIDDYSPRKHTILIEFHDMIAE